MGGVKSPSLGRSVAYALVVGAVPPILFTLLVVVAAQLSSPSGEQDAWHDFVIRIWSNSWVPLAGGLFIVLMQIAIQRRRWTRLELGTFSAGAFLASISISTLVTWGFDGFNAVVTLAGLALLFGILPCTFALGALLPKVFGIPLPNQTDPTFSSWLNAKVGRSAR